MNYYISNETASFIYSLDNLFEFSRRLKEPHRCFGPFGAVLYVDGVVEEDAAGFASIAKLYIFTNGFFENVSVFFKLVEDSLQKQSRVVGDDAIDACGKFGHVVYGPDFHLFASCMHLADEATGGKTVMNVERGDVVVFLK